MTTLIITGKLLTRSALHIGAGKGESGFDALLQRTAAGDLKISGAALGGALRAIATRLAPRLDLGGRKICKALQRKPDETLVCGCAVCHLFGELYPQEADNEKEGGRASRLWVYDATLKTTADTWIRDGVGINRATGAAARQGSVKFDLEVLPAEAVFDLRLELKDASEEDELLLAAALAEWQAGRGTVGGRVSRGLGAFSLEDLAFQERDLNEPKALMAFLHGTAPNAGLLPAQKEGKDWLTASLVTARTRIQPAPDNIHVARSWVELRFTLQATGPLLVNDPTTAGRAGFDHAPLIENGRPVLPGSSLRGVLRSHAERIARTLATERAANGDEFLTTCPACSPVARPRGKEDLTLECCDALLVKLEKAGARDSADEVATDELCLACQLFGSPRLGSRLIVEDAALKERTKPVYKVQDFLAIDRFTGGGKDGAKFDAAALWRPAFTARIRLENPWDWELGWLALVLRDLAEGWLTVGFGAAKGFGQVWVPQWTATIGFITDDDFPLRKTMSETAVTNPDVSSLLHMAEIKPQHPSLYQIAQVTGMLSRPESRHDWGWQTAVEGDCLPVVKRWVAAFNAQVSGFSARSAGKLPPLLKDSYFNTAVESLYPKASTSLKEVVQHDQA